MLNFHQKAGAFAKRQKNAPPNRWSPSLLIQWQWVLEAC